MEFRELVLRNGREAVSRLGFGCEPLGGFDWGDVDIYQIRSALKSSIELGWNFFDTASIYGLGESERRLGEYLVDSKSKAVVSTKIGMVPEKSKSNDQRYVVKKMLDSRVLIAEIEASLKRLKTKYIPLVYLHYPDPSVNKNDVLTVIDRFINEGKIGGYGLSNFTLDQAKEFNEILPISALQFECSALSVESKAVVYETIDWCRSNAILSVAYGVLGKGLLSGKFGAELPVFMDNDRRSRIALFKKDMYEKTLPVIDMLNNLSRVLNKSMAALSIRFVLDVLNIDVAIVGIKNLSQLKQNNEALSFRLDKQCCSELKSTLCW